MSCCPAIVIVFATDAMAQRLLAEVESGTPPDWDRFWDLDPETWRQEIEALRDQNAIVNDDCTLLVLRFPTPVINAPEESEPESAGESPGDPGGSPAQGRHRPQPPRRACDDGSGTDWATRPRRDDPRCRDNGKS